MLIYLKFLASPCSRDAVHKADYAVVATCLSVCPSVTRRYSVEVAGYHQIYLPSGSHIILAFLTIWYHNTVTGTA